ncbi:MAG: response regulator [Gemmatimonadaceae bacterium]|nr:response regulator [Gemmatimonadaceae bacterium]
MPRLVDARLVVRRLEPMLRRLLREDILLHVTMPPYPLWLRIEAAEFERVLVNLILNARDAIAGAGDIWLSLARVVLADRVAAERDVAPGAYAEVLVQDTGAGMPSDALARAFEPFFSTKGAAGTGLGLSTVYGIARHGGGYAVARAGRAGSPDDRGMTFRVGLPEATSVDDDAPEEAPPRAWMGPAMTGDVLIAEDDAAVAGLLADALRAAGHRVRVAGGGTAAKRWLHDASVPVDLLLTDVVMPGDSGPMLVHEARRARPGLPVLFISGYPDDELARHREMYAEVPLLRKPFAVDDLLAAVQEQLLPRR